MTNNEVALMASIIADTQNDKDHETIDRIKWLIEQYQEEIEKRAEDRRDIPMSLSQAILTTKIGVYGKVVADLKELLESEGDDE